MHLYNRFTYHFLAFWQKKALLVIAAGLLPFSASAQRNPDIQLYYELLSRIELLEQEIRQLRGDLEVYQYRSQPGQNPVSSSASIVQSADYRALERRVEALERKTSGDNRQHNQSSRQLRSGRPENNPDNNNLQFNQSASAPQINVSPRLPKTPPSQVEQNTYNTAFNLLLEGRYERAINEFRIFLDLYPNSSLAGDAYYWLGESYYVIRDFSAAEEIFLALGSRYPESEKIPDTLLKLGYLYSETGRADKAGRVLQKLVASYPNSQAANLAQKQLRLLR